MAYAPCAAQNSNSSATRPVRTPTYDLAPHLRDARHRMHLLCFLPARTSFSGRRKNPRQLSARTQRRRLREPARSELRIQGRQTSRRRLRVSEIKLAGRGRNPLGRNHPPGERSRTAKRNPILKVNPTHPVILSEVSASRSEALTQSKDPYSLAHHLRLFKPSSPHSGLAFVHSAYKNTLLRVAAITLLLTSL